MDTVFCQGIICSRINNGINMCKNHGKYDGYCGVHRVITNDTNNTICKGTTLKGKRCSKIVKYGTLCNDHIYPANMEHRILYAPDILWPFMYDIRFFIKKCGNAKQLDVKFKTIENHFNHHLYDLHEKNNIIIIIKIELIFRNYFIDYTSEHWQKVIKELQEYLAPHGFLKKYREHFRKKFDLQYRKEKQNVYIEKVLNHTDLGIDIAKKITSYLL